MKTDAAPERLAFQIRIASPCSADWDKMSGSERVRHCTQCNLNVYNFSAMTSLEVEQLLGRKERLCARFYRRADGTILTQDCPRGLRAVVRRLSKVAGVALSALMSAGCAQGRVQALQSPTQIDQKAGAIELEVVDPSGAVIADARVLLKDDKGQVRANGATNQAGMLRLISPVAGSYSIEVTALGFETHTEKSIVKSHSTAKVEVKLEAKALQGAVVESSPITIATADPLPPTEIALLPSAQVPVPTRQVNPLKRFFRKFFHK